MPYLSDENKVSKLGVRHKQRTSEPPLQPATALRGPPTTRPTDQTTVDGALPGQCLRQRSACQRRHTGSCSPGSHQQRCSSSPSDSRRCGPSMKTNSAKSLAFFIKVFRRFWKSLADWRLPWRTIIRSRVIKAASQRSSGSLTAASNKHKSCHRRTHCARHNGASASLGLLKVQSTLADFCPGMSGKTLLEEGAVDAEGKLGVESVASYCSSPAIFRPTPVAVE